MKSKILAFASLFIGLNLSAQQAQNGSFEDGTYSSTAGASDPVNWGTLNMSNFSLPATTTLSTTDPFHSNTNVVLETLFGGYSSVDSSIEDTIGGAILTGDIFAGPIKKPHTTKLKSVSFRYKSSLVNNDTSIIVIQLTKYNSGTNSIETLGQEFLLIGESMNTWTQANLPITYILPGSPDSLLLLAQSSYGSWPFFFGPKSPQIGTTLELDAIVFCDTFSMDFDTTIVDRTVSITSNTSATGNGGKGNVFWTFGDGSSSTDLNPSHEYVSNGNYTIMMTLVDSCGNSESISKNVLIDSDLSVNKFNNLAQLSIYPNPTHNKLNIDYSLSKEDEVTVYVSDMLGRQVSDIYQKHTSSDKIEMNIDYLDSGNYMVIISTKSGMKKTEKIVVY
jgi:PKD repeat protein